MSDKLILAIFTICLLMALILLGIGFSEPVANAAGAAHPEIAGMQIGADGAARLANIAGLAFAFQSLLLLLIVCLSILGVSPHRRDRWLWIMMAASYGFMMLVWWQMYAGHQEFLASGTTSYFLGFPVATAWQMYGTWLGAIPLVLIYSIGFNRFIYSKDDAQRFGRLLNEARAQRREHSEP